VDNRLLADELSQTLSDALARLCVRAWRIALDPVRAEVTLPMLRGVWGAALHELHQPLYHVLFEGQPSGTPAFLLRPAPKAPEDPGVVFEFVLFGDLPPAVLEHAWLAWDRAARRGLGPQRQMTCLRTVQPLSVEGQPLPPGREHAGFPLGSGTWPFAPGQACCVTFATPLRLLREKRLITQPTLPDLTVATLRRLSAQAPAVGTEAWQQRHRWLELAREVPAAPFRGGPADLVRYSARQQTEVELRGVSGELYLPTGPGPLADLLLAATWLSLGKSTVQGMGHVQIAG
jgi:hypothetical protein